MTKNILLGLLVVLFSLPSFAENLKETAYERVIRTGTLKCGYILIPPETMKDINTGEMSGIAFDIATEAAKRLGLKVEWAEEVNFLTMTEGLKNNRYDAVCFSLYRYSSNAREADFSAPLFYSGTGVFVRQKDNRFDANLTSINSTDTTIATIDGEMSQFLASESFPKAKTLSMPQSTDLTQMMLAVETKKADVAFVNGIVAKGYLSANPGKLKNIAELRPLRIFSHGFMYAKGQYDLTRMMDIALSEMHDNGIIQNIINKYDPKGTSYIPVAKPYESRK